jgi:hypothetical protein
MRVYSLWFQIEFRRQALNMLGGRGRRRVAHGRGVGERVDGEDAQAAVGEDFHRRAVDEDAQGIGCRCAKGSGRRSGREILVERRARARRGAVDVDFALAAS